MSKRNDEEQKTPQNNMGSLKGKNLMSHAWQLEKENDYPGAIEIWKRILKRTHENRPRSLKAIKGIARCLVESNQHTEYFKLFERYLNEGVEVNSVISSLPNRFDKKFQDFPKQILERMFELSPENSTIFGAYSSKLRVLKDLDGVARTELEHGLARNVQGIDIQREIEDLNLEKQDSSLSPNQMRFWEMCGKPYGSFEIWARKARWNASATKLVHEFLSPAQGDINQIFKKLDGIAEDVDTSLIEAALRRGKGCIATTNHIGPLLAAAAVLDGYFENFRIVGGYSRLRPTAKNEDIFLRENPIIALKKISQCLKKNEVIGCAPDSVHPNDAKRFFEYEFGKAPMQTVIPALQYRTQAACVWFETYWENGKLKTVFRPMPDFEVGESEDSFLSRWCEIYLSYLVDLLKNRYPHLGYAEVIGRDWTY